MSLDPSPSASSPVPPWLAGRTVLFASPRPHGAIFGGLELMLVNTMKHLATLGVQARTLDPYDRQAFEGAAILHVFGSDYPIQQTVSLAKRRGLKVVVTPQYYPLGFQRVFDRLTHRIPRMAARFQGLVFREADRVLPNSRDEARLIGEIFGIDRRKLVVVHNGVDPLGELPVDPAGFRKKWLEGLEPERRFVLCVGRIERRKNMLQLAQAALSIHVPVVFVGPFNPSEPEYQRRFEQLAQGSEGLVRHVPWLAAGSAELASAFAAAHVHALPSDWEAPGIVSLEAALLGCNLVVGDCPPVREYLEGRAWFVPPRQVRPLGGALREALDKPKDYFQQRAHVAGSFSWQAVARSTLAQYAELG